MNKVMDEARMYDYFFDLVSRGGKKEISKLKDCLENDPKSNFYGKGDPKHMINRKNFLGQTPISIASKHGNLAVV
tara:strand:+ start:374 stop:598 length:225 start_codon:yes stop_codon:yes gene_type:complete